VEQLQHFKTFVSHGSATRFLRNGEKYYFYFIDNLLLFPTVKECSKSDNRWWSYRKKFDTTFISEHSVWTYLLCILLYQCPLW